MFGRPWLNQGRAFEPTESAIKRQIWYLASGILLQSWSRRAGETFVKPCLSGIGGKVRTDPQQRIASYWKRHHSAMQIRLERVIAKPYKLTKDMTERGE